MCKFLWEQIGNFFQITFSVKKHHFYQGQEMCKSDNHGNTHLMSSLESRVKQ